MSANLFDPSKLEPVKTLCAAGTIPMTFDHTRKLCQRDKFPAVKQAGMWQTTQLAVRSYFYKGANKAFRRLYS